MSISQIIVLTVGIIMLILTFIFYAAKKLKLLDFLIWMTVWTFFVAAVLFFERIRFIGEMIFNLEIMDFFLFFAVIIIFMLLFFMHNNVKNMQGKLDEIIEHIAVKDGKRKVKKMLKGDNK